MTIVIGGQAPTWVDAFHALARRVIGSRADSVQVLTSNGERRSFEYSAACGNLTIAATDAISASVALHSYLRSACGRAVSWDTALPLFLPMLPDSETVTGSSRVAEGYYLNFCTFSYTTPYWFWPDWEREIDWMALHGITMPLSAVGHEATLLLAYSRLGLAEEDIRKFLGGPGYLPFQYMGCLDSFGGELTPDWIERHRKLGRQILDRQRALGMTPILPSFAGHVPRQLAPSRVKSRLWHDFETWFLDPSDPLYREVGAQVTRAQIELYGTDHLYATDPFIEMLPVDTDPEYPSVVAASTLAGLIAVDSEAIWVLQSWPFSNEKEFWTDAQVTRFLDSIPDDRLIILDLWAESEPQWARFDRFSGKSWVWCALLNFGGRTDPIGDLDGLLRSSEAAVSAGAPLGIGLSMEGSHNNAAFFELAIDQIWNRVTDPVEWLDRFVAQRYGLVPTTELKDAWRGLLATVYSTTSRIHPGEFQMVTGTRPSYGPLANPALARANVSQLVRFDPAVLANSWNLLIDEAERNTSAHDELGHDLIDVATAALCRVANRYYLDLLERTTQSRMVDEALVTRFLETFDDLDRLLSTRPEFTLKHWETQAASWATSDDQRADLIDNARRILTVWDRPTTHELDGYAARNWAGLVGGYHRARWQAWTQGLSTWIRDPATAEHDLDRRLRDSAEDFLANGAPTHHHKLSDVATESRRLFERYGPELTNIGPERPAEDQEA